LLRISSALVHASHFLSLFCPTTPHPDPPTCPVSVSFDKCESTRQARVPYDLLTGLSLHYVALSFSAGMEGFRAFQSTIGFLIEVRVDPAVENAFMPVLMIFCEHCFVLCCVNESEYLSHHDDYATGWTNVESCSIRERSKRFLFFIFFENVQASLGST
jgi:hypothetical protein